MNKRTEQIPCSPQFRLTTLTAALGFMLSGAVYANPEGMSVVAGQASASALGGLLEIRNTPNAILNWQQFNIAPGEITRFIQDHAVSAVFNRVTGQQVSEILGTLQSNGQVFLINPNGILFGAGAVIDTAGFVASTLATSNADLLAGHLQFTAAEGGSGSIKNLGQLKTHSGGSVVLIASSIENHGIIVAEGEILLAAGHQVTLVDLQHLTLALTVQAKANAQAINLGEMIGRNTSLFGSLVGNQGYVEATGVQLGKAGTVQLVGTQGVTVSSNSQVRATAQQGQGGLVRIQAAQGDALVAGSINVSSANGSGGQIEVTGQRVALLEGAILQADGAGIGDGGQAYIGGGWQGQRTDLQNSTYTVMQTHAQISANAGIQGDGGEVVLWADHRTEFQGEITAQGGLLSGTGGQVETSGKQVLQATGQVNVHAKDGGGLYLLDPGDIEIVSNPPPMTAVLSGPFLFNAGGSGAAPISYVLTSSLVSAIQSSSGDVVVTTAGTGDGNITVVDPIITSSIGAANSLKLIADGSIFINAPIDFSTLSPGTKLELTANNQIQINSNVILNAAQLIANYNVDSGFVMNGLFSNSIPSPPPLLMLKPFVLSSTRQPSANSVGLRFGPNAASPNMLFDLDFSPFVDGNGRFGANVTTVDFVTGGNGLPYSFGSIKTSGIGVEFLLPQGVNRMSSNGEFRVDLLDINSNVSFVHLLTTPNQGSNTLTQVVDVLLTDLIIRSNGRLILNPYTIGSFDLSATLKTELGAELVLNGNPDPNAHENLIPGIFQAGAVLDVTFLGGQLNPMNLSASPFLPGEIGLKVIAKGFDSRIQNDVLDNATLSIGSVVDIVADAGVPISTLNSGSTLVANVPDFEDVLSISNYDSQFMPGSSPGLVGTVNLAGKVTSNRGLVSVEANQLIFNPGVLIANGPQAAVSLKGNQITNQLINSSVVRNNGGFLGLSGTWENQATSVNPFAQGSIVAFEDLTVKGGSLNTESNRMIVIDDALVNFRGVSLSGKFDLFSGAAMMLGYSDPGIGTLTSLNNAQISLSGYDVVFVEGNSQTAVATLNGVGEIRSSNQGNAILASNFIPGDSASPTGFGQPNTLNIGSGIQVNALGNQVSIRPDGYVSANLNGGEPTFTFGRLPAALVAIFEYDEFLEITTTPLEYGSPSNFILDGVANSLTPLDCSKPCFGIRNDQSVNYAGNISLGNGGALLGDLNLNNVTLSGKGVINGNVTLNGTSILSIGNSAGQLTVNGNMTLGADSVSRFELIGNGQQAGIDFDFLKVAGTLTRGGRLELIDLSGGTLTVPQNFRLIEAAAFLNQFTQLTKTNVGTVLLADPVDGLSSSGLAIMTVSANAVIQSNSTTSQTLTQAQQPTLPPPILPISEPVVTSSATNPSATEEEQEAEQQLAATLGTTPTQQSQNMEVKTNRTSSQRPVANCQ